METTNNKNEAPVTLLEYAGKPSLVAKRLGRTIKADNHALLHMGEHSQVHYDPEQGIMITVVQASLKEGMNEVKALFTSAKLPMVHDGEPLITSRTYCFTSGHEVALMESAGFKKTETTWEWKG